MALLSSLLHVKRLHWPWPPRRFRRPRPPVTWAPGIELRIRTPAGDLIRATSEHLYFVAKYGGAADADGWFPLIPGPPDMPFVGFIDGAEFTVDIRPCQTLDRIPADDA